VTKTIPVEMYQLAQAQTFLDWFEDCKEAARAGRPQPPLVAKPSIATLREVCIMDGGMKPSDFDIVVGLVDAKRKPNSPKIPSVAKSRRKPKAKK
jgi:hypothetical protein